MTEYLSPATEYAPGPHEQEQVDRFVEAQNAYREANPDWRFTPKLLGATAAGVLVAADIVSGGDQLSYRSPSWALWIGSLEEPELPEPMPIFSALTDLDRGNSGTIGHAPTNPVHIEENTTKLRGLEERMVWFSGVADAYKKFCHVHAQFGTLFLPVVFDGQPKYPPQLGKENILPILGQDFYISG